MCNKKINKPWQIKLFISIWLICALLIQLLPPPLIIQSARTIAPDMLEPAAEVVAEAVVELLPEPAVAYAQTACGTDPDDLGGTIWRDYNSDGIQDANELGFDGVTVTAYDNDGNGVTTTVNTDGTYNFSDIFATETHIRLEFSGLPDWMESSVHGTNSDTTVQIHTTATCDADLAVQNPSDYCESNPQMLTSCYIQGGTSTASSFASVVRWDKDGATSGRNEYIEYTDEIGSLYGLTYQQASNLIFAGAFAKRHAAWGDGEDGIPGTSDDTGAIYVLNNIEIPDTASNVVDIITIPNSGNTPRGVDGPALFGNGGDCSTATTGTDWVRDSCFFDSLGKEGLGDLDLSHDGNTLWVVNLNDRHLYMVDVTPGGASYGTVYDKGEIADPGCAVSGDWRPFALEFHDGELYVGGVCSGETGNNPSVDKSTTPWTYSDNIANVSTHVLRFNDPFNSANGSAAATEIFEYTDMDYNRGLARGTVNIEGKMDGRWFAWVSEWNADVQSPADHRVPYPQPILSDIEFDTDGSMILGFRDRGSDQTGHLTRPPGLGTADDPVDNTNLYQANSGGDLIRVCWNGSSYEWEGTGSCPTNGNSPSEADTGAEATAEFYHEDYLDSISNGKHIHQETAQGALAFVPRLMDVASTVMDPFRPSTGGTRWFDNTNGTYTQPYEVFKGGDGPDENGLLNKANGLGDLEFICMPAPLEIGNYVWEDTDSDGIQDPNEAPIAGLTVTLYDMDNGGVQVGTATTDANGHYYFGSLSDANMTSGSLLTDNDYEVRISLADSNLPANASVTTANANGDVTNDNKTDLADSDAIENSGDAVIAFTTGDAGENNHTLDFGFATGFVNLEVIKTADQNSVNTADTLTYTLTITNSGDITATNVIVTDTLPAEVTLQSTTPAVGSCGSTNPLVCNLGDLAPGATTTIQVVVIVDSMPIVQAPVTNPALVRRLSPFTPMTQPTATASRRYGKVPGLAAPAYYVMQIGPSFVSESTAMATSNTTSLGIAIPGGLSNGDVLVAGIAVDGNVGTLTPPAGWVQIDSGASGSAVTFATFYRIVNGDSGTATFTWSGNQQANGSIRHYTGVDPANPIHASAVGTGSSSTPTAPSVTTTVADTMIVRMYGQDRDEGNNVSFNGLSNTHNARSSSASDAASYAVGDESQAGAGATGTHQFSTGNEEWRAATIVLQAPQGGTIVIVKDTVGPDGTFDFTSSDQGSGTLNSGSFQLTTSSNSASTTFSQLTPGTYNVAETVPAGWSLTSAACDNGDTPDSVSVAVSETVTCTFTNTDVRGSITIIKNTSFGDALFDFTSSDLGSGALGSGAFQLTTNNNSATTSFNNLIPGTYNLAETVPADWTLDSASCSDSSDPSNIVLDNSEDITCTFINSFSPCPSGHLTNLVEVAGNEPESDTTDNYSHACVEVNEIQPVQIGDRVWIEDDNDGLATTGVITPVVGSVVTAVGSDGTIYTDTTDAMGYYTITVPANGVYTVTVGTPTGTVVAVPTGGLVATDNDPTTDDDTSHDPAGTVVTVGTEDNLTIDFGFYEPIFSFELSKTLNTPPPARVGERISFTIRITNTGTAIMTQVPLTDTYNNAYMSYTAIASPEPDIPTVGELVWSDLTSSDATGFGMDLNPGATFAVTVEFITKIDTTGLPNDSALNVATSQGITDSAEVQAFSPTSVDFVIREVAYENGRAVIRWETADESNVVGFHIYREVASDDASEGEPIKLTPKMLIAEMSGSTSGASYIYEDTSTQAYVDYRYFVGILDTNGFETQKLLGDVLTQRAVDEWFIFLPITVK